MRATRHLLVILALLATTSLVACGGGDDDAGAPTTDGAPDSATDDAATDDDAPLPGNDGGDGSVQVTLEGGPHAGDYEAEGVDTKCSVGLAGEDAFGVQYSDLSIGDGEMSSVQAVVTPTGELLLATVTIGSYTEGGTNYDLDDGTADVEVDPSEDNPTLVFDGTTADGVGVSVTVVCDGVLRN